MIRLSSKNQSAVEFKCGCGGAVRLQSDTGVKQLQYRGLRVKVPRDYRLPVCSDCKRVYYDRDHMGAQENTLSDS